MMERMRSLEGEAAQEEEEHAKDAIASAYAGESEIRLEEFSLV